MVEAGTVFLYLFLVLSGVIWVVYLVRTWQNATAFPRLDSQTLHDVHDFPLITVIVPSRNESRRITACIQTLKAQTYPRLEFIIADDSTDETTQVIKTIVGDDPRFTVMKQPALEPGWVGKPFAIQQASARAHGEWLLFVDADTSFDPHLVDVAFAYVNQQKIDMLSLSPYHTMNTFWERTIQPIPLGLIPTLCPIKKVNDPASTVSLALGPFILLRYSTFMAVGGYQSIKSRIADDVSLAQIVKAARYKINVADGRTLMSVRMYENIHEIWDGWTKNILLGFAQKRNLTSKSSQMGILLGGLILISIAFLLPFLTLIVLIFQWLFTGSLPWQLFGGVLLLWLFAIGVQLYVQHSYSLSKARYSPLINILGGIMIFGIFANAGLGALFRKKVSWKGRSYSATN